MAGIDNDTRRVESARLGAVAGIDPGTRGTRFFDDVASRRGCTDPSARPGLQNSR